MKLSSAILAGGSASRLGGIPKGLLTDRNGISILAHSIAELVAAGITEVILSTADAAPYRHLNLPVVADLHPGIGPLGGIEAILTHLSARCDAVLLLPCDLPNIARNEILRLVEAHVAQPHRVVVAGTFSGEHPLFAVVPLAFLSHISASIAAGRYGVQRLWKELGAKIVTIEDESRLANINTPEDLEQWRK